MKATFKSTDTSALPGQDKASRQALLAGLRGIPRPGAFRFHSHEEADAWLEEHLARGRAKAAAADKSSSNTDPNTL